MRGMLIGLLALSICLCGFASVTYAADAPGTASFNTDKDKAPAAGGDTSKELFGGAKGLTIRQRREMGLTIPKISSALQDLQKAGEIEAGMSKSEMAAKVLEKLSSENPKAYADPSVSLEDILAFIEAILPLIVKIIGLFSWMKPALPFVAALC